MFLHPLIMSLPFLNIDSVKDELQFRSMGTVSRPALSHSYLNAC